MYKIKQVPEDFIVKEVNSNIKPGKTGNYSYFLMKKREYTTERAIQAIANFFKTRRKFVNYAGNKDKNAVTYQYISINNLNPRQDKDYTLKDIELKFLGRGSQHIYLGFLNGNKFEIIVRNLNKAFKPDTEKQILNLFDEQRFSKNNVIIGKNILHGDFKEAVNIIIKESVDYEEDMKEFLNTSNNDYVGALRKVPQRILTLFVNSYQSFIFNKTIKEYTKKKHLRKNIKVPIIGFGTEFKDKEIESIIEKILKKEKVNLRDFIIRKIPELSSEGNERNLFLKIKALKIGKLESDELNKGKKKINIKFELCKGSYATIVIKNFFN
jgi:tRNA pseudouridine13 synthase